MSRDFEELLASFNAARVRYLIGGAHALALHARPRATKDLDVFIDPTPANARRLIRGLAQFFGGQAPSYVTVDAILDPDTIVQLGVAPVRVDILSAFATISFREAWKQRENAAFGDVPAHYLSRDHLISEKKFFDRPQDRADVAILERTTRRKTAPRERKSVSSVPKKRPSTRS